MRKILGVDPGLTVTGYGIISSVSSSAALIDYGLIKPCASHPLPERLWCIYREIEKKIQEHEVTDLALETPFLGKNAQNFLKLGYVRGVLQLLVAQYSLGLHEFSPREIKSTVTGYGAADKDQVARMMLTYFPGLQWPNKFDLTDALAVTLCATWKCRATHL